MVDENFIPKIADFGISRVVTSNAPALTMAVGTSGYIAPEVILSQNYNNKCDVFSFAVMMYQVIFNVARPYGNAFQIDFKIAQDENFRPEIPQGELLAQEAKCVEIMKKGWKADPMARPSFAEICDELEALQQQEM